MTLLYFAWVRQKDGRSEETFDLPPNIHTVAQLAEYLKSRGGAFEDVFSNPSRLRVAVNQDHAAFDAAVSNNDEVAFFPPVTGG